MLLLALPPLERCGPQITREELAATQAVVAEQKSTEQLLRSEAEETKGSLLSAETDVEGLRGKVARQVGFAIGFVPQDLSLRYSLRVKKRKSCRGAMVKDSCRFAHAVRLIVCPK